MHLSECRSAPKIGYLSVSMTCSSFSAALFVWFAFVDGILLNSAIVNATQDLKEEVDTSLFLSVDHENSGNTGNSSICGAVVIQFFAVSSLHIVVVWSF